MDVDRTSTLAESHLATLELDRSASREDVKRAYRTLVKVWHPDRFVSDAPLREVANTKLGRINEAYAWLNTNWDAWIASRDVVRDPGVKQRSDGASTRSYSESPPFRREAPNPPPEASSRGTPRQSRSEKRPFTGLIVFLVISGISALAGLFDNESSRATPTARTTPPAAASNQQPRTSFFGSTTPRTSPPPTSQSFPARVPEPLPLAPASPRPTPIVVASTVSAEPAPDVEPTSAGKPELGARTVIVQAGDTLSRLASRYGTTVDSIRAANEIAGDLIRVGQVLRLPAGALSEPASIAGSSGLPVGSTTASQRPDLSGLSREEQRSIESACFLAQGQGPAAYNTCLNAQMTTYQAGPQRPDLSGLSREEQRSIESACFLAQGQGPGAYNTCLIRQLDALQ